jgi:hypothetical protein
MVVAHLAAREYDISRGGAILRLGIETGPNRLEVGGWYESNSFRNARLFYGRAPELPIRAAAGRGRRSAGPGRGSQASPPRASQPSRRGGASSTSRIFAASSSIVNGFPIISTPGSSTPLWTTALRV